MQYRERAPFKFNGTIHSMKVEYLKSVSWPTSLGNQ